MSDVSNVAAWSSATAQAQVEAAVGLRVLKLAQEAGNQTAQLVEQAVQTVTESLRSANTGARGPLDTYA